MAIRAVVMPSIRPPSAQEMKPKTPAAGVEEIDQGLDPAAERDLVGGEPFHGALRPGLRASCR